MTTSAPALLGADCGLPLDRPFTVRTAELAGISRQRLRTLAKWSLVRRLLPGVYVLAQVPDSVTLRARAIALVVQGDAVATDWTACWVHTGLDRAGAHLREPELTVFRPAGRDRLRNDLCDSGERTFRRGEVWFVDGLAVTSPLRTAWDLGRLAPRDRATGALDALLRQGSFDRGELLDGMGWFKWMRGVVQLRALAPLADPRSESPGESTLRLRWLDLTSLPRPTPQVAVGPYRVDLGVPELRYGCEYDGAAFHGPERDEPDAVRREDLGNRFAWDVDAVRRNQVFGPTRDVERILYEGVDRARKALGRPTYLV